VFSQLQLIFVGLLISTGVPSVVAFYAEI
jgi:hypothetical protein